MVYSPHRIFRRSSAVLGFFAWALPSAALACACCVDPGHRAIYDAPVDGYVAETFDQIQFGPEATVFVTACDIDCVQGIENPDYAYAMSVDRQNNALTFQMQGTDGGGSGSITLVRPTVINVFSTDIIPSPDTPNPQLYKEWRMSVPIKGDGAFAALSSGPYLAELVLQGGGNACDAPQDFTHWMLSVKGRDVDFRLFGPLKQN